MNPAEGLSESLIEGTRVRVKRAINELLEALHDDASRAAEAGAWLLSGPAGQGKTHTMLDAAEKAINRGELAAVVLGEQMRDEDPLTEVARRLGLGDLGHDVLLQALDAAGAASSSKFLLAIDAVNDMQDPTRWRADLGPLLAQLADYPHVALALSCRETLLDVIMPPNLSDLSLPMSWHPGFGGREAEALERYLRDVPYVLPRVPLLLPTFSNPLFVKLYAENLRRKAELLGRSASVQVNGTQHRAEVFEGFLDARATSICEQLHLDPAARPVHQAVAAIAARMGETGVEVVEREEARKIVDVFAPHRNRWPDTMLGKLVAYGLLTTERYYRPSKSSVGVAFPYQAFSDDRVLRALLAAHQGDVRELQAGKTLAPDAGLRRALEAASPNIREAATILLPELAGAELIDVLGLSLAPTTASSDGPDPFRWLVHALVTTLPQRAASSVTDRTVELINLALRQFNMHQQVITAALALSTEPHHILNAERLHTVLLRLTRAERDAWWTIDTYDCLDSPTPLHRLIRWAEQLPTPQQLIPGKGSAVPKLRARRAGPRVEPEVTASEPPAEVVRLGALTLCWALASSNRFLRDRATKALVQLLLGYPDVIIELVDRFLHLDGDRVDDPYIFERLVLASYGFVLRVGHAYPDEVGKIARKILDHVYGDVGQPAHASRSALLCDAARNVVEAAVRMGALDEDAAQRVRHPHPANHPGAAPTKQQLEQRLNGDAWLSLTLSLHTQGDFGAYEVEPAIRKVSKLPASRPRPAPRDQRREHMPVLVEARLRQFRNALPDAAKNTFGSRHGVLMLLSNTWVAKRLLSEVQLELLAACRRPPPKDETLIDTRHEAGWANRWILARVRSLGWTPDRFGDFDRFHGRGRGREAHKAERIGKKYQWLGLFELGERLTNHYHLDPHFDDEPDPVAAWQLDLRDLDPSLPPAPHPFANDTHDESKTDDDHALATFAWADPGSWMPPVPDLPAMQELQQWIENGENLPDLHQVEHRSLPSDTRRWIVLDEFVSDTPDGRGFGGKKRQPEQWHHINSWLVDPGQLESILTFIETRSLVPRWMPDGRQPHGIYLGEFPHAYAARDPYDSTPEEHHELSYTDHDTMQDFALPDVARQSISKLLRSDLDQLAKMSAFWDWWSSPSGDDSEASFDDDELDDMLDAYRGAPILSPFERHHRAVPRVDDGVDEQGNPLRALPATQDFSWPATGADCSLEANVNGALPTNILLADTSLTRHPDKLEWFDENGSLVIMFMRGRRDTGEVHTLLACEDWLIRRLATLSRALVIGLFGERQQVTETPTIWSTFSQPAGLNPTTGKLHVKNTITRLQRRVKD